MSAAITTNTDPSERQLDTTHRCDTKDCAAQAWHRATLASGGQLYFCAHHGREVMDVLLPQCAHWLDETKFLNAKPESSAAAGSNGSAKPGPAAKR